MDAPSIIVPGPYAAEDAHTISRKGARMPRVELITRGERRRVWTLEQKREIVTESLGPALTPDGKSGPERNQLVLRHSIAKASPNFAIFSGHLLVIEGNRLKL